MDVELSQGLEERFLRSRANKEQRQLLRLQQLRSSGVSTAGEDGDEDVDGNEEVYSTMVQAGLDQSELVHRAPDEVYEGENGATEGRSSTTTPPASSDKNTSGSGESGGRGYRSQHGLHQSDQPADEDDEMRNLDDFSLDYPANFPGQKQRISIRNETVLVTRMDGVNINSGTNVSLYKCHLCGKVFNFLSKLQCHLSLHFEHHITLYQCSLCDANFKFKLHLFRHLRRNHGIKKPHIWTSGPNVPRSGMYAVTAAGSPEHSDIQPSERDITPENKNSEDAESASEVGVIHRVPSNEPTPVSSSEAQPPEGQPSEGQPPELTSERLPGDESIQVPSHMVGYPLQRYYIRRYNHTYVCRYCNKTFFRLFSLQRHERIHTSYKPCHCRDCGKGFSEPRNLHHHMVRFHPDHEPSHKVKHVRRTILSGLSRTSQRLAPVTPDMIEEANKSETPPETTGNVETKEEEPQASHSHKTEEVSSSHVSPSGVPVKQQLASVIREKERLAEDVTVVIPSDAPLDGADSSMETPRSNISDNTSWGEVAEQGNMSDSDSSQSNEVVSAPWKSIMAHKQSVKSKRKGNVPQRISSPTSVSETGVNTLETSKLSQPSPTVSVESSTGRMSPAMCSPPTLTTSSLMGNIMSPMLLSTSEHNPSSQVVGMTPSGTPLYLPSPVLHPGILPPQLALLQGVGTPGLLSSSATAAAFSAANMEALSKSQLHFGLPPVTWPQDSVATATSEAQRTSMQYPHRSSALSRSHSRYVIGHQLNASTINVLTIIAENKLHIK